MIVEQYIKKTKSQQYSRNELQFIIDLIKKKSPCNLLVFGIGFDTEILNKLNLGLTVFLEHDQNWINKFESDIRNIIIRKVKYKHYAKDWKLLLNKDLLLTLPNRIKENKWDIIIVDAPVGNANGRMESIYTASQLKWKHCLIHDCERNIERTYSDKYFGKNFKVIRKLRHYANPN